MPPNKRRIFAVAGIAAAVFMVLAVIQQEPAKEEKYNRRTDQTQNVFTDRSNRNASLDSLAGQIQQLREETERRLSEQQRLAVENARRLEAMQEAQNRRDADVNERLGTIKGDLQSYVKNAQEANSKAQARVTDAQKSGENREASAELAHDPRRAVRNAFEKNESAEKSEKYGRNEAALEALRKDRARKAEEAGAQSGAQAHGESGGADPSNPFEDAAPPVQKAKAEPLRLAVFSEPEEKEASSPRKSRKDAASSETYIPAGSILTGTIITGGDFPTNKGAFDAPTPLLIRVSKEAILPNRFRSDIRECFLLAGGAGDLASERAKLRGESLSCVRRDGSVIETRLDSYVTGEDGKEGVKGRVVSKQGQFIARSLMAGFLGGMSEAFDVNPVPVIATSSTGEQQYQDVMSANAFRGAAVKGASDALERVAQFYLDMAEDIFPVIEINAGRQVDIVVISGTSLRISAKSAFDARGRKAGD